MFTQIQPSVKTKCHLILVDIELFAVPCTCSLGIAARFPPKFMQAVRAACQVTRSSSEDPNIL